MPHPNGQRPEDDEVIAEQLMADLSNLADVDELYALAPVVRRLQRWKSPQPDAMQSAALLARLEADLSPRARRTMANTLDEWWPALLLRSQVQVVRREIWAASALIIAIGVLVTMATLNGLQAGEVAALPLVILAPAAAALGAAFLYDPFNGAVLQLELATRVGPRLLLLTRLVLLFGFNLALAMAASLLLAWWEPTLPLWPLVMGWLAPMTLLASLAYLLTSMAFDPVLSMLMSLSLWTLQHLRRWWDVNGWFWFFPDLTATGSALWPFGLALTLALVAFLLSGRETRWQQATL